MRGPFSTLYGNASGGVIQVFTENGPPEPTLTLNGAAGSYGTSRSGLKFGGQSGALNYIGGASHLETTGYRDHSAAEKDLGNAKLKLALGDDTRLAFILNAVRQPAQDPAGLRRDQVEQNPRQVDASIIQMAREGDGHRGMSARPGGLMARRSRGSAAVLERRIPGERQGA